MLALYWLSRLYAHTLGMRLRSREPLNASLFLRGCLHELPLIEGAVIPFLVLLAAWAAGVAVASGVTAALWATVVVIVALEIIAGGRSRGRRARWLEAAAGAAMGLALIALRFVLH